MGKTKTKKAAKETPLMKQYNAIKAKHPGALLLFRVGDFYETFGDDAVKASKILDIVLTKRANGSASHIELAGFPHHSLDTYLPKLVRAGQRVAICDQLEDPKSVKGIVKRGVTELVTPGVSFNDNVLKVKHNNYLASVYFNKNTVGIAFLDISTGEFLTAQGDQPYIDKLIQGFQPAEVLFCKTQREIFDNSIREDFNTFRIEDWVYSIDYSYEKLTGHFGTNSLKGFGIENLKEGIIAAGAILYYLEITEHHEVSHISNISRIEEDKFVWLDKFTIRNLELVYPQHEGGVPLIDILDHCVTPMGARMMKKWVVLPLKSKSAIENRLNTVAYFSENEEEIEGFLQPLQQIGDLERLISKVAVGRINPRELNHLKRALKNTIPIKTLLLKSDQQEIKLLADKINLCEQLIEKIDQTLVDNPPLLSNQGGMIKEGLDAELDDLRKIAFSGKDYLVQIQQREMERTGIPSLKIAYNKVFGYYLEVTNAHKDKVPPEWIRKQTLVNAERYITEELKVYEEKILNAESQIFIIEQKLFQNLVVAANEFVVPIQQNAIVLAMLDCYISFAGIALKNQYIKPEISEGKTLAIREGRHPVIEQQLPPGENYIPNDIRLDDVEQQILIITGPNMAGKSALLRQTALIVLMAQIGCFVPAKEAHIGIVDKIFTRVGASDNLSKGESTFMVEMTETASILNNLSDRSLVLMDEIGRGTSTYDGISIAWSIVEYLHNQPKAKAKTLFATHYHELNQLAGDFPRIKNFNVSVKELGNKVVFMRKLKPGGSEHSFGIHVAQMAGMPNNIVIRANEILHHLEKDKIRDKNQKKMKEVPQSNYQLNLFEVNDPQYNQVKEILKNLDINTISPVEALLKLNEIKGLISKK
ncbi:DNA mismatch repair protein MutS [Flexithrix dorotheae]|uniref:DNA mismatch repair protein MutS n=1 Tax=Flexithrix dorotheae TaxID=70993 RepID=UPI000361BCEA